MMKVFRTFETRYIHYIGPSGAGKSHKAFEGYSPETHYVWKNEKGGWWDKYRQQEIVILNDYRAEIPFNEFCAMIDRWPFEVTRRGRDPLPFMSKLVIITSIESLEDMYGAEKSEPMEQLRRRGETIRLSARTGRTGPEVVRGNNSPDHKTKDPIEDLANDL